MSKMGPAHHHLLSYHIKYLVHITFLILLFPKLGYAQDNHESHAKYKHQNHTEHNQATGIKALSQDLLDTTLQKIRNQN